MFYENVFCNLGRAIRPFIKTDSDLMRNEAKIKAEEVKYVKYVPKLDEIKDFLGNDYMSLDYFKKMYMDIVDVELDDDIIFPYQWPLNI